jgi:tellurite resistance protein TehA-like permease
MLSLLLPWFETIADTVAQSRIAGYIPLETLALSVAGGILSGTALVASSTSRNVGTVRSILVAMGFTGGLIALVSPIYLMLVIIPRLNVVGRLELGFFAALFTAVALFGVSGVAAATRVKQVRPYPYGYAPLPSAPATEPQPHGETSFVAVESVEAGIKCPICYLDVDAESGVKCTSCGVIYHSGCVDTWVDLNRTCPNCQRTVV